MKGAFDKVDDVVLARAMKEIDLPQAAKSWVSRFVSARKTSLIVDWRVSKARKVGAGILQGLPISPLLFLIITSGHCKAICDAGAKVIGFVDDITIYTSSKDANKKCYQALGSTARMP